MELSYGSVKATKFRQRKQHTSRDPILRIRSDLGEKLLSQVSRSSSPGSSILAIAESSNVVIFPVPSEEKKRALLDDEAVYKIDVCVNQWRFGK